MPPILFRRSVGDLCSGGSKRGVAAVSVNPSSSYGIFAYDKPPLNARTCLGVCSTTDKKVGPVFGQISTLGAGTTHCRNILRNRQKTYFVRCGRHAQVWRLADYSDPKDDVERRARTMPSFDWIFEMYIRGF